LPPPRATFPPGAVRFFRADAGMSRCVVEGEGRVMVDLDGALPPMRGEKK
jgi:hypothetical protein